MTKKKHPGGVLLFACALRRRGGVTTFEVSLPA